MKTYRIFQAAVLAVLLISSNIMAEPGVLQIDQACVDVGCFGGDDPGFPVEITAPGNYELTSDLNVPSIDLGGILSSVPGVTLDLNGFSVTSVGGCSGEPLVCTIGSGTGISLRTRSVIKNGSVTGFGNNGVWVDDGSRVANMFAEGNGSWGFRLGSSTVVRDSVAIRNQKGFAAGRTCILDSIVATENIDFGVALNGTPADGGSVIRNCSLTFNGTAIFDWGNSKIENCALQRNVGAIDSANGGTEISSTQIIFNTRALLNRGGERFSSPPPPVVIRDSTFTQNELPILNGAPGEIIWSTGNVCDSPAC